MKPKRKTKAQLRAEAKAEAARLAAEQAERERLEMEAFWREIDAMPMPAPAPEPPHVCAGPCAGIWDLVLIGCGSEKRSEPCAAADLYVGSLYLAHRRILECLGLWRPSFILSAKYGAIWPHEVVEPYEHQLGSAESAAWGERVAERILQVPQIAQCPGRRSILVLAGAAYVDPWAAQVRSAGVFIDEPLRGCELGERLQFAADFAEHLRVGGHEHWTWNTGRHMRCYFGDFLAGWRARLDRTRVDRKVAQRRVRTEQAAQMDMFVGRLQEAHG